METSKIRISAGWKRKPTSKRFAHVFESFGVDVREPKPKTKKESAKTLEVEVERPHEKISMVSHYF